MKDDSGFCTYVIPARAALAEQYSWIADAKPSEAALLDAAAGAKLELEYAFTDGGELPDEFYTEVIDQHGVPDAVLELIFTPLTDFAKAWQEDHRLPGRSASALHRGGALRIGDNQR
jgi:hypothetical protein